MLVSITSTGTGGRRSQVFLREGGATWMCGREKRIASRGQTLLDGEKNAGGLAFAHHTHDVISGRKLLSVRRFGFALEQNHSGRNARRETSFPAAVLRLSRRHRFRAFQDFRLGRKRGWFAAEDDPVWFCSERTDEVLCICGDDFQVQEIG